VAKGTRHGSWRVTLPRRASWRGTPGLTKGPRPAPPSARSLHSPGTAPSPRLAAVPRLAPVPSPPCAAPPSPAARHARPTARRPAPPRPPRAAFGGGGGRARHAPCLGGLGGRPALCPLTPATLVVARASAPFLWLPLKV